MKKAYSLALVLLAAAAMLLAQAPAAWLAPVVQRATQGTFRLEQTWGTVWNGQAQFVVQRSKSEQMTLPGQIAWDLNGWALCLGKLDAALTVQGQTLALKGDLLGPQAAIAVPAGHYALPATSLATLGSPFNTLQLQGEVRVQWGNFSAPLNGVLNAPALEFTVKQLQTRITGAWILGGYALQVPARAAGQPLTFQLRTSNPDDALQLAGQGKLNASGAAQFELRATPATEAQRERLQALLNLLGRREGAAHVLRIGAM